MEIQYEDRDPLQKLHEQWAAYLNPNNGATPFDLSSYKHGIEIHYVNARTFRMSKRRQKIAIKRGRSGVVKVLRGAYPIIVDAPHEVPTEITLTFNYESTK